MTDTVIDAGKKREVNNGGKDALLACMAHELRGPLNVCVMWLDLLDMKASQPAEVKKAVEVMRRNLASQARLLRELDDIAQIFAAGVEIDRRELMLADLLDGAAAAWRIAAAERNVALEYEPAGRKCRVAGDAERLLQVFNSAFENALLSTPSGGRIAVRLKRTGDWAEVEVTDTGVGVESEELQQFFAAPLQGPRREKSLGLRLVIAKHLIERHGGSIDLQSAGPQHGCTLVVRLPVQP